MKKFLTLVLLIFICSFSSFVPSALPVSSDCPWCESDQEVYLSIPNKVVQLLSCGHVGSSSTYYYMTAISYYGHHAVTDKNFTLLPHFIKSATDLDPQLYSAYLFGAIVIQLDTSYFNDGLILIEKARRVFPQDWIFPFLEGYYYWKSLDKPEKAAHAFAQAAILPGAPIHLAGLPATILSKAGKTDEALRILSRLEQTISDLRKLHLIRVKKQRLTP